MFAVAELSWRFFEKPLIDIGHRLRYDGMLGRAGHGLELG
jgi:peptidoglycan/LPS O-acetylase OafA/YrhL